jgi:hypothetical protein
MKLKLNTTNSYQDRWTKQWLKEHLNKNSGSVV